MGTAPAEPPPAAVADPGARLDAAVLLAGLPPKYRELIIENALTKCIDKYDFEWQLHFAVESILQDEILGQIEDHFRDYCESNGVVHPGYEYDELCVEERG